MSESDKEREVLLAERVIEARWFRAWISWMDTMADGWLVDDGIGSSKSPSSRDESSSSESMPEEEDISDGSERLLAEGEGTPREGVEDDPRSARLARDELSHLRPSMTESETAAMDLTLTAAAKTSEGWRTSSSSSARGTGSVPSRDIQGDAVMSSIDQRDSGSLVSIPERRARRSGEMAGDSGNTTGSERIESKSFFWMANGFPPAGGSKGSLP